jgi:carbonic anhydrase
MPPSETEPLARLLDGNRRFVSGRPTARVPDLGSLADGQQPFAVVLGCSDSRVPVEIVFDVSFGELFVVRVAGNIVAPSQIASIELAAERFGTRLVVVLGHTHCGAVEATLDAIAAGGVTHLRSIVDRIRPAVEHLAGEPEAMPRAVRANISASVRQLREALPDLVVVGAEFALETGEVVVTDP